MRSDYYWTEEEDETLRARFPSPFWTVKEIAESLDRNEGAVRYHAARLGLRRPTCRPQPRYEEQREKSNVKPIPMPRGAVKAVKKSRLKTQVFIEDARKDGRSDRWIAEKLGVPLHRASLYGLIIPNQMPEAL